LPSGERIVRKFTSDTSIEDLYAFVECHDVPEDNGSTSMANKPVGYEHHYQFNLVSPMPRMVYDLDSGGTLGARIGRSGNLIVEPIFDEDDELGE